MATTFLELTVINKIIPLRVSLEEEIIGADQTEHGIFNDLSALYDFPEQPCSHNESVDEREDENSKPSLENQNDSMNNGKNDTHKTYFSRLKLRSQTVECWRRKSSDLGHGITVINSQSTGSFTIVKECFDNTAFHTEENTKERGKFVEVKDQNSARRNSAVKDTNETKT